MVFSLYWRNSIKCIFRAQTQMFLSWNRDRILWIRSYIPGCTQIQKHLSFACAFCVSCHSRGFGTVFRVEDGYLIYREIPDSMQQGNQSHPWSWCQLKVNSKCKNPSKMSARPSLTRKSLMTNKDNVFSLSTEWASSAPPLRRRRMRNRTRAFRARRQRRWI